MNAFTSFFKKELLELSRNGKLLLLSILFVLFGILNAATAKLTPQIFKMFADTLESSGLAIGEVEVTALQAWEQFFKNLSTLMIIVIIVFSNIFAKEYNSGTLIPLIAKGLSRRKIAAAKSLTVQLAWAVGYWVYFAVTDVYAMIYWDNSIAKHLASAAGFAYLFGAFLLSVMLVFAAISDSTIPVLLGTGGVYLVLTLCGMIPKCKEFLPTKLADGMAILNGITQPQDDFKAMFIALFATVLLTFSCIFLRKQKI